MTTAQAPRSEVTAEWVHSCLRVWSVAQTYEASTILFAAVELGLFSKIPEEGVTTDVLAAQLRTDPLGTQLLLDCLCGYDMLAKSDRRYFVAPDVRALVTDGELTALPNFSEFRFENEVWLQMARGLTGAAPLPADYGKVWVGNTVLRFPGVRRFNREKDQHVVALARDAVARAARVLEPGGGDAIMCSVVLETNPNAYYTILELEDALPACRAMLEGEPHRNRVDIIVGDARTTCLQGAYDLVIVNDLLAIFTMDEQRALLRNAVEALKPGGTILVVKFTLDPTGTQPPFSAIVSLRMTLSLPGAFLPTDEQVVHMLREAGCSDVDTHPVRATKCLIVGRRGHP
jgi:hypothetical protein